MIRVLLEQVLKVVELLLQLLFLLRGQLILTERFTEPVDFRLCLLVVAFRQGVLQILAGAVFRWRCGMVRTILQLLLNGVRAGGQGFLLSLQLRFELRQLGRAGFPLGSRFVRPTGDLAHLFLVGVQWGFRGRGLLRIVARLKGLERFRTSSSAPAWAAAKRCVSSDGSEPVSPGPG